MKSINKNQLSWYSVAMILTLTLTACGGGSSSDAVDTAAGEPNDASVMVRDMNIETFVLESDAEPAHTPGSPGVTVINDKLLTQYGSNADLNRVRYTRYADAEEVNTQPDAILVAIPGTLGGAHNYLIMAENLIRRAKADGQVFQLWAVDRRSTLLEDTAGLQIAEREGDAMLALDFLYGGELGLALSPELDRRAVFYDSSDVPFMANWSPQVHSMDIDAVVERARATVRNNNVFLGGHSAGTGFVARYAATDFNFSNNGDAEPGYGKLRGLVV